MFTNSECCKCSLPNGVHLLTEERGKSVYCVDTQEIVVILWRPLSPWSSPWLVHVWHSLYVSLCMYVVDKHRRLWWCVAVLTGNCRDAWGADVRAGSGRDVCPCRHSLSPRGSLRLNLRNSPQLQQRPIHDQVCAAVIQSALCLHPVRLQVAFYKSAEFAGRGGVDCAGQLPELWVVRQCPANYLGLGLDCHTLISHTNNMLKASRKHEKLWCMTVL